MERCCGWKKSWASTMAKISFLQSNESRKKSVDDEMAPFKWLLLCCTVGGSKGTSRIVWTTHRCTRGTRSWISVCFGGVWQAHHDCDWSYKDCSIESTAEEAPQSGWHELLFGFSCPVWLWVLKSRVQLDTLAPSVKMVCIGWLKWHGQKDTATQAMLD